MKSSNYIRFGQLSFSNKEVLTIRLLLSHRNINEISRIQGCSEEDEYIRVNNIKKKLNCEMVSQKGMFFGNERSRDYISKLRKINAY
ncbi:hypothetical protein [Providencia hangzhouensis]|uniref:hypothetical protein n=1 Tax=Providencia hangzhouensis TaxID=3031799 RepID=UPI0034DDBCCA